MTRLSHRPLLARPLLAGIQPILDSIDQPQRSVNYPVVSLCIPLINRYGNSPSPGQ